MLEGVRSTAGARCALALKAAVVFCMATCFGAAARAEAPFAHKGPLAHRAQRKAAVGALPYDKFTPEGQKKVDGVLSKITMYRKLPTQVICCDPELFVYMTTHPEILANIWMLLEIDDVVLTPESPGVFRASDEAGTTGSVEFLYRDHENYVLYANGTYDGPLFQKPVTGSCVLHLKAGSTRESNGRYYVTCELDAFVRLDHMGAEFWTKTLQPLVGHVADMSFTQTASFVESLSRACGRNPGGMCRLAERLEHVHPLTREEFVRVTAAVAERQGSEDVARTSRPAPAQPAQALAPAGPVAPAAKMARGQNR